MIQTHSDITKNIDEHCDVCVVGSGAGGAVVAKELAEAGLSVILLEEGGYFKTEDFQKADTLDSISKLYRDSGGTVLLGKPNVMFSEGRCVGGSTTINGGMCWRTPDKILKRWQWEKGLADMTPKRMEPYFQRVEKMISVNPVLPESMNRDSELLKKGADKLGYRVKPNQRAHHYCVGTNQCITGCPTGGKQSTLVTYIPAFIRAGGRLIANCRVKKLKFKGSRSNGISGEIVDPDTHRRKTKIRIRSRITVVCGGAIQTPSLLLRSGTPNPNGLIGRNLLVHPNAKVVGIFEDPVYAWQGVNQAYQVTEFIDEGILCAVNFVPPGIVGLALPFYGPGFLDMMKDIYNHAVGGAALIEDTSRGRVHALPFDQTVVTYHLNRRDFEQAKRAVALLSEIYFAAGAKRVFLPFSSLTEIHTIDEIRKIYEVPIRPGDLELMSVHVMGTCQMGVKPENSVVNQYGEHHRVQGLFVADASIFPTSIGVNPQVTIMAMATRIAQNISDNRGSYL